MYECHSPPISIYNKDEILMDIGVIFNLNVRDEHHSSIDFHFMLVLCIFIEMFDYWCNSDINYKNNEYCSLAKWINLIISSHLYD